MPKSKGKGKPGKDKGKASSSEVRELQNAVTRLTNVVTSATAASGSGGASPLGASPLVASNVLALASQRAPTQQGLELVTDSVNRILESIGQATSQCISTARILNEEGTRLRSALMAIEQTARR